MQAELNTSKQPNRSRTMWFNGITLGLAIVALITDSAVVADYPKVIESLLLVNAIGNLVLRRYFTTQPITRSGKR